MKQLKIICQIYIRMIVMKKSPKTTFPGVRKKAPGKFILDFRDHNNKRRQITYLGIETDAVRARKALLVKRDRIIAGLEAPPEAIKVPPPADPMGGI